MKRVILTLPLFLLTACGNGEAYSGADSWSPSGANAQNIAAMIANPHDLVLGRSEGRADARQAAGAVDRVRQDKPKPLLSATTSAGGGGDGAGAAGSN
jgi:type IV pilus biogenesis protein CpaD/CtpE